jgi:hypothetical protein
MSDEQNLNQPDASGENPSRELSDDSLTYVPQDALVRTEALMAKFESRREKFGSQAADRARLDISKSLRRRLLMGEPLEDLIGEIERLEAV